MSRHVTQGQLTLPIGKRDHALGPATARVTMVEYGDFECPHCGEAHYVVNSLIERVGPRMRFVYRHFPLATVHPHAEMAAEAAEAAASQGKFWQMHATLFEHQDALDAESLAEYAAEIGLDESRFTQELASREHAPRVREDFLSGVHSGVNGTPAFFINGLRHDGGYDFELLLEAIEAAEAD
jgi:protein-disulfide isomerase